MIDKTNILSELKESGAVFLLNADKANYFFVPDNYFNTLAGDIMAVVFIQSLPFINIYTVPKGYFESFSEIVLEKIKFRTRSAVPEIEKNLYAVPDGYFNNLSENILKRINNLNANEVKSELEELSPFLSSIPKTNVFSIPKDYFDEAGFSDVKINNTKSPARVISIGKARKWINYAVAASIAVIALTGGYFYFSKNPRASDNMASLSKMDIQKEMSILSDDEITNYLKNNNNIAVYTNYSGDDQQQGIDIQSLIQEIPDEEIQQYLRNDPEEANTKEGI